MAKQEAKQPLSGIQFITDAKGNRTSTFVQKKVWSAVLDSLDPSGATSNRVKATKNWRYNYREFVEKHVQLSLKSPEAAMNAATIGLESVYNHIEFIRDGKAYSLAETVKLPGTFHTYKIQGQGVAKSPSRRKLAIPYEGKILHQRALKAQLKTWADAGTIEKDALEAILMVSEHPEWLDLSDFFFVIFGATSAMGPLETLLGLGANIIAIDIDREATWDHLIKIARKSRGTMTFPLSKPLGKDSSDEELSKHAGCNLLLQVPEILNWIKGLYPNKRLVVGNYVYMGGEAFVRIAVACDVITKELCRLRPDSALSFLNTPMDVLVVPDEARVAAHKQFSKFDMKNILLKAACAPLSMVNPGFIVSNARKPIRAIDGESLSYVNSLVYDQGPNYALAKRLQMWRCMIARKEGHTVSSNVAPSTATKSVLSSWQFRWSFDGMQYFSPFEVFQQDTTRLLMTSLMIHDLRNPKSAASPSTHLRNPLELFAKTSFNGGTWRMGYKIDSVSYPAIMIHFLSKKLGPVVAISWIGYGTYYWLNNGSSL